MSLIQRPRVVVFAKLTDDPDDPRTFMHEILNVVHDGDLPIALTLIAARPRLVGGGMDLVRNRLDAVIKAIDEPIIPVSVVSWAGFKRRESEYRLECQLRGDLSPLIYLS